MKPIDYTFYSSGGIVSYAIFKTKKKDVPIHQVMAHETCLLRTLHTNRIYSYFQKLCRNSMQLSERTASIGAHRHHKFTTNEKRIS